MLLRYANLSLLILFPIAWVSPLIRAGLLPLFGLSEISVLSGIASLWEDAPVLSVLVALFAIVAPYAKTLTLAAVHFRLLDEPPRGLHFLGRLAMADIFLIAIYIVVVKGVGLATVEVAWGLYLFTGCILASLFITSRTEHGGV